MGNMFSTVQPEEELALGTLSRDKEHPLGLYSAAFISVQNADTSEGMKMSSTLIAPPPVYAFNPGRISTYFESRVHARADLDRVARLRDIKDCRSRFRLTAFKLLLATVLLANALALDVTFNHMSISYTSVEYLSNKCATAVAFNLLVAVLMRQDYVLNTFHAVIAYTPRSSPFFIRKNLANFHHHGGVHVGCAVSAVLWYIPYALASGYMVFKNNSTRVLEWANLITCWTFVAVLIALSTLALPVVRRKWHNTFETTHRFGGWFAIASMWVHLTIGCIVHKTSLHYNPVLYILGAITLLLIRPWLCIRCVAITSERISNRAIMFTFPYKAMPYSSTMRFSTNPLVEWHGFATIPGLDNSASIIVAEAGDWTRSMVQHPPRSIWIRNPATRNFLPFACMFNHVLFVATGAGIGPILSFLIAEQKRRQSSVLPGNVYRNDGCNIAILWCAPRASELEWKFARDIIRQSDPSARIIDSKDVPRNAQGKVDLLQPVAEEALYRHVEAVFIVSNKELTDQLTYAMGRLKVAAYGAVFDS